MTVTVEKWLLGS